MPSMGVTGEPPDMRRYPGRGWEPDRTYLTPRLDGDGSSKSAGGRAGHADGMGGGAQQRRLSGWEGRANPGRLPVQPGIGRATLRQEYYDHQQATFPGPNALGEADAHAGFAPRRGPLRPVSRALLSEP